VTFSVLALLLKATLRPSSPPVKSRPFPRLFPQRSIQNLNSLPPSSALSSTPGSCSGSVCFLYVLPLKSSMCPRSVVGPCLNNVPTRIWILGFSCPTPISLVTSVSTLFTSRILRQAIERPCNSPTPRQLESFLHVPLSPDYSRITFLVTTSFRVTLNFDRSHTSVAAA